LYSNLNLFLSFVGWGFARDPTECFKFAYSAPPDPLAGLWGGAPGKGEDGGEGKRREGRRGSPEMPKSRVGKLNETRVPLNFVQ